MADDSFPGESRDIDESDTGDEHLERPKQFRSSTLMTKNLFEPIPKSEAESDDDFKSLPVALPGPQAGAVRATMESVEALFTRCFNEAANPEVHIMTKVPMKVVPALPAISAEGEV